VQLPPILYGTAWKREETAQLVSRAFHAGFRGFDTACQPKHYDEAGVGRGIAACAQLGVDRGSLYLQTKFTPLSGQDPRRVPYDPRAPLMQQIAQSCAVSLEHLRTDYLDCLLLHSPLSTLEETLHAWSALERLVEDGKVKQLGISNCYALDMLERLWSETRIRPAVVQNRLYRDTDYDRELRAYCYSHQISYQSFWTLTANPHLLGDAIVITAARIRRRSPAQILFRYLTQRAVVPLTGTRSEQHMRDDLGIFEFELTPEELDAIDRLLQ
jgi:diketogulonate reductase-like aldo/keto reductase